MKKIIFLLILFMIPIVNAGDPVIVKVPLIGMITNEAYAGEDTCSLSEKYAFPHLKYDRDDKDAERRPVLTIGFPSDYYDKVPEGAVITNAKLKIYLADASNAGTVKIEHSTRNDNSCRTCMDWNRAFSKCQIDHGSQIYNEDLDEAQENGKIFQNFWVDLDVTNYVKDAFNSNEYYSVYMKGGVSSGVDDISIHNIGYGDIFGPHIDITYYIKDCESGQCCDSKGNFKTSNNICNDDAGIRYGCPNGNKLNSDVYQNIQKQFCSGQSSSCNGEIKDGDWSLYKECGEFDYCDENKCSHQHQPPKVESIQASDIIMNELSTVSITWSSIETVRNKLLLCETNELLDNECVKPLCSTDFSSENTIDCSYNFTKTDLNLTLHAFVCDESDYCSKNKSKYIKVKKPPLVSSPLISGTFYSNSTITCIPGEIIDPNNDKTDLNRFFWYVNNQLLDVSIDQLDCSSVDDCGLGKIIQCSYKAIDFTSLISEESVKSNSVVIANTPPIFTEVVYINGPGSSLDNPIIEEHKFEIKATGEDIDNENYKLIVCDDKGLNELSCVSELICETPFSKNNGKSCQASLKIDTLTKDYKAYLCDTEACSNGLEGTVFFDLIRPSDIKIWANNKQIYSYDGELLDEVLVTGFESQINEFLDVCIPDDKGYCEMDLVIESSSTGRINLFDLNIPYEIINDPPILEEFKDVTIKENDSLIINTNANDPDDFKLTYDYKLNGNIICNDCQNTYILQTDFKDAGEYEMSVTVSDSELSDTKRFALNILNINREPTYDIIVNSKLNNGVYNFKENQTIEVEITYNDPDDDTVFLEVNSNKFIKTDNKFIWNTNFIDSGNHEIEFSISDGESLQKHSLVFEIENNLAPILEDKYMVVSENELINLEIIAIDPNEDNLIYSMNSSYFNNNLFTWTPGFFDEGIYHFQITVSDAEYTIKKLLVINVTNKNRLPTFEYEVNDVIEESSAVISFKVNDPDNNKLIIFTNDSRLIRINDTFVWQTVLGDHGKHTFTILVNDGINIVENKIDITVTKNNYAPEFDVSNIISSEYSEVFIQINAIDKNLDDLTYSTNFSKFKQTKNVFTWTPEYDDVGEYFVKFLVSDGIKEVIKDILIVIGDKENNEFPIVSEIVDKQIYFGDKLNLEGNAIDNDGAISKYEWDFDGDGSVDKEGKFIGHIYDGVGEFLAKLIVSDNDLDFSEETFKVTVSHDTFPKCEINSNSVDCVGNGPFTYRWAINNDVFTEKSFEYVSGNYFVNLEVCDQENDCSSYNKLININNVDFSSDIVMESNIFSGLDYSVGATGDYNLTWKIDGELFYGNFTKVFDSGEHLIELQACNNDCFYDFRNINVIQNNFNTVLSQGWHLLGINNPTQIDCAKTWNYNGTWNKNSITGRGYGMWALSDGNCNVELSHHINYVHNNLTNGWNLVSLDSILEDGFISDVCMNDFRKAWVYNGTWISLNFIEKVNYPLYLGAWVLCGDRTVSASIQPFKPE